MRQEAIKEVAKEKELKPAGNAAGSDAKAVAGEVVVGIQTGGSSEADELPVAQSGQQSLPGEKEVSMLESVPEGELLDVWRLVYTYISDEEETDGSSYSYSDEEPAVDNEIEVVELNRKFRSASSEEANSSHSFESLHNNDRFGFDDYRGVWVEQGDNNENGQSYDGGSRQDARAQIQTPVPPSRSSLRPSTAASHRRSSRPGTASSRGSASRPTSATSLGSVSDRSQVMSRLSVHSSTSSRPRSPRAASAERRRQRGTARHLCPVLYISAN